MTESYLEHFRQPRNCGVIEHADGVGQAGSATDGDLVKVFLALKNGTLDARFQATGCPAAIASASAATVLACGRTLDEAAKIGADMVEAELGGLPEAKRSCSNLGADALAAAIEDLVGRAPRLAVRAHPKRVAVAMSGGVDSSTSLDILARAGYDVFGLTARHYDLPNTETTSSCCAPSDLRDARRVAHSLSRPHFSVDLRQDFADQVIDRFADAYRRGHTPNPCVDCNRRVRFQALWKTAQRLGASHLATGHYVRVGADNERYLVRRAVDRAKDQSYLFWWMPQSLLAHFLAPLGVQTKAQTREKAAALGLAVADKSDSQDVCFIPNGDYRWFLKEKADYEPEPGPIVDTGGRVLGYHRGLAFYTVGQRRGLGLAGGPGPYYVLRLIASANAVVVGNADELGTREFIVTETNFIPFDRPDQPLTVQVMTRYNMKPLPATVIPMADGHAKVVLSGDGTAVAPGQSAVFYDGDLLVGGGIIEFA